MRYFWRTGCIAAFFTVIGAIGSAQDLGSISGRVVDASAAPIEGVNVLVRNAENGSSRTAVTNKDGLYDAPSLAVGRYEIMASKSGFQSISRTGINLVVGQQAVINLELVVGELKQVVTVEE